MFQAYDRDPDRDDHFHDPADAFYQQDQAGRAMRAVSEDKGAAELMGVNVNQTISITFAVGSALAAVAGVLFIAQYETLLPTLGALPGIKLSWQLF